MILALSQPLSARPLPGFLAPAAFAWLLSAVLAAPTQAETPSLLDAITKSGTLRVGLTEDYRPFSIADASGNVEGIDVDMANNLAMSLGVKLEMDNATIFDALAQGKADLMITDSVETRLQAKLHPGVLCPVHPDAPFDHSELGYWMPRDVIFAAYVDQWLNLLNLTGEHQTILARWLP